MDSFSMSRSHIRQSSHLPSFKWAPLSPPPPLTLLAHNLVEVREVLNPEPRVLNYHFVLLRSLIDFQSLNWELDCLARMNDSIQADLMFPSYLSLLLDRMAFPLKLLACFFGGFPTLNLIPLIAVNLCLRLRNSYSQVLCNEVAELVSKKLRICWEVIQAS